jgi:hypothetical protein
VLTAYGAALFARQLPTVAAATFDAARGVAEAEPPTGDKVYTGLLCAVKMFLCYGIYPFKYFYSWYNQ